MSTPEATELSYEEKLQMWRNLRFIRRVLSSRTPGWPPVPEADVQSARQMLLEMQNKLHNLMVRSRNSAAERPETVNTR